MKGGFILVNKEQSITSSHLDSLIKRSGMFSRIGHLGTLDRLATGLMIIMVDDSTRCAKYFDESSKEYVITVRFGSTSNSLDYDQPLMNTIDSDLRGKEVLIDKALDELKLRNTQIPPKYSAIKIDGRRYSDLSRESVEFTLKERKVRLLEVERLTDVSYLEGQSYVTLRCHVTKGFYVRSLARDLGELLNVPSMAHSIERTKVGQFDINDACTASDIANGNYKLINPLDYLNFEKVVVNDSMKNTILNGVRIPSSVSKSKDYIKIYSKDDECLAIYKYDEEEKVFKMDYLVKR